MTMKLGWYTGGASFSKERIVVLSPEGAVQAIFGDGPTSIAVI